VFAQVFDTGCTAIVATGGVAQTLQAGGLVVADNHIHHMAQWKRSYQPGVFWLGVNNTFLRNTVQYSPHNCFTGGGDFGDAVNNLFQGNTLEDCTFETIDSGAFYSSGQQGTAFVNTNNVLRNNTFKRVYNVAGTGVQVASNQATYLDDQMSYWELDGNTFELCQVGSFIGGGRGNLIHNNVFKHCGTVQYLNNQGMTFDKDTVQCDGPVAPPFQTTCSTAAAVWMTSQAPAAARWLRQWPQLADIRKDDCGQPAHNVIQDNAYCDCPELISSNVQPGDLTAWHVVVRNNTKTKDC